MPKDCSKSALARGCERTYLLSRKCPEKENPSESESEALVRAEICFRVSLEFRRGLAFTSCSSRSQSSSAEAAETLSLYLEGRGISLRNTYEVILGRAGHSLQRTPCPLSPSGQYNCKTARAKSAKFKVTRVHGSIRGLQPADGRIAPAEPGYQELSMSPAFPHKALIIEHSTLLLPAEMLDSL
ncbi:hypothetical protein DNTS_018794 [Danionella cerebrum]|uniref:Uncharacterized protein n=1 Tax=Danionella cerebrum TaxID=2873325 RepID=A0A553QN70_9TELE|nr:hypothetical protein DNTS_018794 [Danionella translucida]